MRPSPELQVRWGLAAAALALAVLVGLAFVPDPLLRQQVFVTHVDDVEQLVTGAPIYFRGAVVGSVRGFDPEPDTRLFLVRLGVKRSAWRPTPCAFARIHEVNPFAVPRIELVSPDQPATTCAAARLASGCVTLDPPSHGGAPLAGCRRSAGLFETAALAMTQAAEVAKVASAMALQVQGAMGKPGGARTTADLTRNLTETLASVNGLTAHLNASLAPGGDLSRTLVNVRNVTDHASAVDVTGMNAAVAQARAAIDQMQAVVKENQAQVHAMVGHGEAVSQDTRALMESLSGSIVTTAGNLQRATDALDALTQRLSDDPTYVLRGQRFQDPPPPGGAR